MQAIDYLAFRTPIYNHKAVIVLSLRSLWSIGRRVQGWSAIAGVAVHGAFANGLSTTTQSISAARAEPDVGGGVESGVLVCCVS